MPTPQPLQQREALHRRAEEVQESILADEQFMEAIREGVKASERGEPGVPLRELQAQERAQSSH
jgi:hypothetical protein